MKFSILVPVYNVEKYIRECVTSILNQSYKDYEVVLVNDGSTDRSYEICEWYCEKYPETFKLLNQENKGLLQARRAAINAASGDYCVCLDSDDMLHPCALSILSEAIETKCPDIIVFQASRNSDYLDPLWTSSWFPGLDDGPRELTIEDARKILATSYDMNAMWNKAIKREYVGKDIDYSDYGRLQQSEDLLQVCRVLDCARTIIVLPNILYYYRQNPQSLCRTISRKSFYDVLLARSVLAEFAEKWNPELIKYVYANTCFEYIAYLLKVYINNGRKDAISEAKSIIENSKYNLLFDAADFSFLETWKRVLTEALRRVGSTTFIYIISIFTILANALKPGSLEGYR